MPTDTAACEHFWFTLPDDFDPEHLLDSMTKQVCGEPAPSRMTWLGSHGHPDREVAVCDSCRESIDVQNMLEQAKRDGALHELLFREVTSD